MEISERAIHGQIGAMLIILNPGQRAPPVFGHQSYSDGIKTFCSTYGIGFLTLNNPGHVQLKYEGFKTRMVV